jgi:hypothetical protein
MKYNIFAFCAGTLVGLIGILLVLSGSFSAWSKVKYCVACVILGMVVCYVGDKLN